MSNDVSLTVGKALRLIRQFSVDGPTLSIADIARRLDVPRSTASRMVATLYAGGHLRKTSAGTYGLGLKFIDYAGVALSSSTLRIVARPEMLKLRQALGLSTHLSLFDRARGDVVHVERLRAGDLERFPLFPADRIPLHATSSGRAHLAFAGAGAIEQFCSTNLDSYTASTPVTLKQLQQELDVVKKAGYAVGCGGFMTGVSSIAMPILDGSGRALATVSVNGLTHRFDSYTRGDAIERLHRAVNRIRLLLHESAAAPL